MIWWRRPSPTPSCSVRRRRRRRMRRRRRRNHNKCSAQLMMPMLLHICGITSVSATP